MTKFSEFKKQDITNTSKNNNNDLKENDISALIDKYSRMDRSTLMQEFLSASRAKREAGGLDDVEINRLESVLSPYLNDQQKETFKNLMEMGKNVE